MFAGSSLDISLFTPISNLPSGLQTNRFIGNTELSDVSWVAVALTAIEHIKTRNGVVIPELATFTCDVPINLTVLDTMNDITVTLQQHFHATGLQGSPDAIVGPQRSSTSIPLSFVSIVDASPIVGFSATSVELDNKASQ